MLGACSSTGAALFNVNFLGAKLPLLSFSITSIGLTATSGATLASGIITAAPLPCCSGPITVVSAAIFSSGIITAAPLLGSTI